MKKNERNNGCLVIFTILMAITAISVVITSGLGIIKFPNESNSSNDLIEVDDNTTIEQATQVEIYFDSNDYIIEDRTVTEEELIEKLGKPDSIDEWKYQTPYLKALGRYYPMKTYIYGTREYLFTDDQLVRISLDETIPYNNKRDLLAMFGLKPSIKTKINDLNVSYRANDCIVNDFWIWEMDETNLYGVKITYYDIFD